MGKSELKEFSIVTRGSDETARFGDAIGRLIKGRFNIALTGELGSGKTVLAGGIGRGLGVIDIMTSPSFIIVNEYQGRLPVYHLDLYRVETEEELESSGFDDILGRRESESILEWAEKADGRIPPPGLDVSFNYISELERKLTLVARGDESRDLLVKLEGVA